MASKLHRYILLHCCSSMHIKSTLVHRYCKNLVSDINIYNLWAWMSRNKYVYQMQIYNCNDQWITATHLLKVYICAKYELLHQTLWPVWSLQTYTRTTICDFIYILQCLGKFESSTGCTKYIPVLLLLGFHFHITELPPRLSGWNQF